MWAGQTHQVQADLTSAPHGAPGRRLQKISCPNPPNRDTRSQKGRWHTISQAKRLQGNTRAKPLRDFGELHRMARGNGCLMWSSSSHIARGHWANTQPSAVRPMRLSSALTSTECCPQPFRHHVGGSDSSGPGRPDLAHMARLDDGMQQILCPNPPNRGTRPQKGR